MQKLTRRDFLNKAAVGAVSLAALHAAGSVFAEEQDAPKTVKLSDVSREEQADVVVIGSGYAGFAAALQAEESGAKVVLLEKLAMTGGSSAMSGGILTVPQKEPQESVSSTGAVTSIEDHFRVWYDRTQGNCDTKLIRTMLENSEDMVFWLMNMGVVYNVGTTRLACQPTDYVLSAYSPSGGDNYAQKAGSGKGGIAAGVLASVVESRENITLYTETAALSLIQETDGSVKGLIAEMADGSYTAFYAKSVVIAAGGFGCNPDMIAAYSPMAVGSIALTCAGTTGDGIRMGMEAGAATVFSGGVIGCQHIGGVFARTPTGLTVNAEGIRCFDEALHYSSQYKYRRLMDGSELYWCIYDKDTYTETLDTYVANGRGHKADSLEELAQLSGMDPVKFLRTVERYNSLKDQYDLDFGKRAEYMKGIGEGPYYAIDLVNAYIGTIGGLKINEKAEVISAEGAPIPGLYAAGESANGEIFYDHYAVSGGSLMSALTIGRMAGKSAAEYSLS